MASNPPTTTSTTTANTTATPTATIDPTVTPTVATPTPVAAPAPIVTPTVAATAPAAVVIPVVATPTPVAAPAPIVTPTATIDPIVTPTVATPTPVAAPAPIVTPTVAATAPAAVVTPVVATPTPQVIAAVQTTDMPEVYVNLVNEFTLILNAFKNSNEMPGSSPEQFINSAKAVKNLTDFVIAYPKIPVLDALVAFFENNIKGVCAPTEYLKGSTTLNRLDEQRAACLYNLIYNYVSNVNVSVNSGALVHILKKQEIGNYVNRGIAIRLAAI